jgi:hypothetical protein
MKFHVIVLSAVIQPAAGCKRVTRYTERSELCDVHVR